MDSNSQRPPLRRTATAPLTSDVDSDTIDSFPTPPSHTQNTHQPWLLRPLAHPSPQLPSPKPQLDRQPSASPLPPPSPKPPRPAATDAPDRKPPPLLLRKRHSAHTIANGAMTPPPLSELPPLPPHAQALAAMRPTPPSSPRVPLSRPGSNSSLASSAHARDQNLLPRKAAAAAVSTSPTASPPQPPSSNPAWLSSAPQFSASPPQLLPSPLAAPPSLSVYPSVDTAARAPRKSASHSIMRPARAPIRPATTEGALTMDRTGAGRVPPWEAHGQLQGHPSRVSPATPAVPPRSLNPTNLAQPTATMYQRTPSRDEIDRATTPRPTRAPIVAARRMTGPLDEVAPWEVQRDVGSRDGEDEEEDYGVPRPMEFGRSVSTGTTATITTSGSSVRSRASSTTGPVEDVTPWEVQAIPRPAEMNVAMSMRSRSSSLAPSSTGPVEDVTPWEVQPHPNQYVPPRSPTAPSMRTNASLRSRASSAALHSSSALALVGSGTASVATGPVEEVVPWEVQAHSDAVPTASGDKGQGYGVPREVPLDNVGYVGHRQAPSVRSGRSNTNASASTGATSPLPTGPLEDVTPWEVQAGPGETVFGVTREVPLPPDSERPRSIISAQSAATGGLGPGKPPSVRSGRSRSSSAVQSPSTPGSIEDVTPWDMYPAPPPPVLSPPASAHSASKSSKIFGRLRKPGTKNNGATTPRANAAPMQPPSVKSDATSDYSRSVKSTHTHKSGFVEDVTPWEVQDLPASPPLPLPLRAGTIDSTMSRISIGTQGTRPVPTGPTEDVTPWETAEALPPQREHGKRALPLGVSVPVLVPGAGTGEKSQVEDGARAARNGAVRTKEAEWDGLGQELDVPSRYTNDDGPNSAMFTSSSGHGMTSAGTNVSGFSHASTATPTATGGGAGGGNGVARGSMTLEQLAEVMPWELHPAPAPQKELQGAAGDSKRPRVSS